MGIPGKGKSEFKGSRMRGNMAPLRKQKKVNVAEAGRMEWDEHGE